MFKSSRGSSAKQNNNNSKQEGEKQKHKKKLSFKEPEVEKPRPAIPAAQTSDYGREQLQSDSVRRRVSSLDDLTLEDQAFQIARNVGFAFVKPRTDPGSLQRITGPSTSSKDQERDRIPRDVSLDENRMKSKTDKVPKINLEIEDQEYLRALSPTKPDSTAMRCPIIEFAPEASLKNPVSISEQRLPTAAHHQIQLLGYQLEQQRQQTQTAMYQIQLLKDQLEAESAARYKAQMHNHQLMMQNKGLLDHIQGLFQQVQELEKKIEYHENKATTSAPSQEPTQVGIKEFGTQGPNQLSYRRNSSSSTQSLWSTSSLLNPGYNPARRVSATSLTSQEVEPKPGEGGRRLSIKDDSTSRVSTSFDTDWRYRRRGSSSAIGSSTSISGNKYSELSIGTGLNKSTKETSKSQSMSFSIPEGKFATLNTSAKCSRSESTPEIDRDSKKGIPSGGHLSIQQSTRDECASPSASSRQTYTAASTGFKPLQTESLNSSKIADSEITGKGNQKKFTKSLQTLRLFNS